jgi:glycerophosphoryl diester phosphodiesterase
LTIVEGVSPASPDIPEVPVPSGWRLPSLLDPPIGFAHRGARALELENTVPAFELALRLGASGIETDAWLTSDGVPILDHDGRYGSFLHRRPAHAVSRASLPAHVPTLEDLFDACGPDVTLSIDIKDPMAAKPVVQVAEAAGAKLERLYLCSGDLDEAAGWGALDARLRLVHSTRLRRLRSGPERHVAAMAERRVHVLNMPYDDWNGGLVALCHRFGVLAFGWGAQHPRQLRELLRMGCDGVYSDHPERLADALKGR